MFTSKIVGTNVMTVETIKLARVPVITFQDCQVFYWETIFQIALEYKTAQNVS